MSQRPRIIRATEVTPEALVDLQQRYATLLRDYISLAESHVELVKAHHALLDRLHTRTTVTR